MSIRITKILLLTLAISAITIGLMIFLGGPHFTAAFFSSIIELFVVSGGYSNNLSAPNVDSEMRFFSVFWFAYGTILLGIVRDLETAQTRVYLALGVFFAGGVGRVLSLFSVGAPDTLFVVLMWIELFFPIVTASIYFLAQNQNRQKT